jgi:hypothetical protein
VATVYFYLLLASGYTSETSWNITPMPSMEVCELTRKEVMKGISDMNYGTVRAPSAAKCVEIQK